MSPPPDILGSDSGRSNARQQHRIAGSSRSGRSRNPPPGSSSPSSIVGPSATTAAEELATDIPGTFGRLDRTLRHLARAEGFYLERLSGWTAPIGYELARGGTDFPGVQWLMEWMRLTGDALIDVARSITPEARVVDEDDRAVPAWVVLLQAGYHATEHRQQIATIPTNLGVEPPEPDLWAFQEARERGEVETEPGSV